METTLNIRTDIFKLLTGAAHRHGMACGGIIHLLIQKAAGDATLCRPTGGMVRYQKRSPSERWHVFHIHVREDVYEYWLDLRKLLKLSVSHILALAVKKYLAKLFKQKYTDNYPFKNYIIMKEVIDNVIIWKLVWGIPHNLTRLFRKT